MGAGDVVTIKDVAARAGVSASTVSRTLGGGVPVDAETRRRVEMAIAELGYRPNRMARNLRRQQSETIGIVISDIENPHFTRAVRAIEDAAFSRGFRVILCNTDETPEKQRAYLEVLAAEQVVGIILAPADAADPMVSLLLDDGVPIVAFDRQVDDERVDAVFADNRQAAMTATEHLLASGRRQVAFVAGRSQIQTGRERLDGYQATMRRHGLPSTVGEGEFRLDRARMAMLDLLDTHVGLDGVVVANNLMTIGVLDALRERGRIVPDEVAIVSIDDPPWSALVAPSLTTLGQPTQRMASRAFELLMDRIEGRRTAVRHEIFHFELHVRDSSGVRAGQAGTARTERAGS